MTLLVQLAVGLGAIYRAAAAGVVAVAVLEVVALAALADVEVRGQGAAVGGEVDQGI